MSDPYRDYLDYLEEEAAMDGVPQPATRDDQDGDEE